MVTNIAKSLSDNQNREAVSDWLNTIGLPEGLDEQLQLRIGPYEPDVLGEYFVLTHISSNAIVLEKWTAIIYNQLPKAVPFLKRCGQDYCESSQIKIIENIIVNLSQRDYEEDQKSNAILNLLFNLMTQSSFKDVARKSIVEIVGKSKTADIVFKNIISESYYFHSVKSLTTYLNQLEDLAFFYQNTSPSALIASKYIELLGIVAYSYFRRAMFLPNHESSYIELGDNYRIKVITTYQQRKTFGEDVEEAYISAMAKILSSLYDAKSYEKALNIIKTVNKEMSSINHERTAAKYLEFYNIVIKNRDHILSENISIIMNNFVRNFERWKNYTETWPFYALQVASVLPHLIEGLLRIQQEKIALNLLGEYQWYHNIYKARAKIADPKNSTWLWSQRFVTGINRLYKAYPQIIAAIEE